MLLVVRPLVYVVLTAAVTVRGDAELSCQSTVIVETDAWMNKDRLLSVISLAGDDFW